MRVKNKPTSQVVSQIALDRNAPRKVLMAGQSLKSTMFITLNRFGAAPPQLHTSENRVTFQEAFHSETRPAVQSESQRLSQQPLQFRPRDNDVAFQEAFHSETRPTG